MHETMADLVLPLSSRKLQTNSRGSITHLMLNASKFVRVHGRLGGGLCHFTEIHTDNLKIRTKHVSFFALFHCTKHSRN